MAVSASIKSPSPVLNPPTVAEDDYSWACEVMAGFAKPNSSGLSDKEATAALNHVCQGMVPNATPGLVQALLDYGADVVCARRKSTNLWKKLRDRDQEDIPSRLVEDATRHCSADILQLVAQDADETVLNQALPVALDQQDVHKVCILLAMGADASPHCQGFRRAVESGPDDLVNLLLRRDGRGACQECRDLGLVDAARLGHAKKAHILLAKGGASPPFQQGAALKLAIQAGHNETAVAIASSEGVRAHTELLDSAVGEAYARTQLDVVQSCVQAGARGPRTDTTLVQAIQHGRRELVRLLVQHQASVDQRSGAAVVGAVDSCDPSLLQIVLGGKPSPSSLSAAVLQTAEIHSAEVAYRMIELLLGAGVRGNCLSQVLVRCLGRGDAIKDRESTWLPLVQLLLEKGRADVNFNDGKALVLAATKGWVYTLRLLVQFQPSVSSLGAALPTAMGLSDPGTKGQLVQLLLGAASIDQAASRRLKSSAVESAARALDYHMLQVLARPILSAADLELGFVSATSTGVRWTTPAGLQIIQFLLGMGASGAHVDQAFCQAAATHVPDAIDLLAEYVSPAAFNHAMILMTKNVKISGWCDIQYASVISFFLERGACGDAINTALLNAVEAAGSGNKSVLALETLLDSNSAQVNFQSGEALRIASQTGNADVLALLMKSGADRDAATRAFNEAVAAPLDEDTVLQLLDVLHSKGGSRCRPFYQSSKPGHVPPIVSCVTAHPTSAKLVNTLAQSGCNMEAEYEYTLYDIPETTTVLLRAMMPLPDKRVVSTGVVDALIKAKANVNYVAKRSGATPLILAAKHRRADLVKLLIKAGAATDHRDCYSRSALYYASRDGDLDAVNLLLHSKHRANDGSLHEAARNLHSGVAAALIKKGHSVNFPSSLPEHEGRTPLQELAYRCDGRGREAKVEATIHAIQEGNVNIFGQWRDKNALFLALENAEPVPVTQALLDTIFWPMINDERNVTVERDWETGSPKYYMSPTVHLNMSVRKDNWDVVQRLHLLLRSKNAQDRLYAPLGSPQPPNAVNLPKDVAEEDKRLRDEEDKRWNRELDHRENLRRLQEERAAHHLFMSGQVHGNQARPVAHYQGWRG